MSADLVDAVSRRTVARIVAYGDDSLWEVLLTSDEYRTAFANMRRELRGGHPDLRRHAQGLGGRAL
jgi:hypothetical protein